jgi:CheY-like chemotaxis protein
MNTLAYKSILVVDDEPLVADTLSLLLMIDKHRVDVARDGETALARYKSSRYDLVITDLMMPGIDGLELARLIRAQVPQQRIILVSGHLGALSLSNRDKMQLQNVDALLGKPFSPEQLRQAVRAIFPNG